MKTCLECQGALLDSFSTLTGSGQVRRSDIVILVKNIPWGISAETIREMFDAHEELSRILISPAGTIVVVEFVHLDEAPRASKAVAYLVKNLALSTTPERLDRAFRSLPSFAFARVQGGLWSRCKATFSMDTR